MAQRIFFRTNLDNILVPNVDMAFVLPIGSKVECYYKTKSVYLEVISIWMDFKGAIEMELHIPTRSFISVDEFFDLLNR